MATELALHRTLGRLALNAASLVEGAAPSHASGFIVRSAGMKASRGTHAYVSVLVIGHKVGALARKREASSRNEMAGRVPVELTMSPERDRSSVRERQSSALFITIARILNRLKAFDLLNCSNGSQIP